MDTDDDLEWLGEDMVQQNGSRITVPPGVVDVEIVAPGESVFWAEDAEGMVISKQRDLFEGGDRFRLLGEATLMENRELSLPAAVTDREGFGAGDILHFVTSVAAGAVARVLTEDMSEQLRS